jgi:hypothetical protein
VLIRLGPCGRGNSQRTSRRGERLAPLASVNEAQGMHLIEIFIPLYDNEGRRFEQAFYSDVRSTLFDKFGGLTVFGRAPAQGMDTDGGKARHDDLIVFEVMTATIDPVWWETYRKRLERIFKQDRVLIRSSAVSIL